MWAVNPIKTDGCGVHSSCNARVISSPNHLPAQWGCVREFSGAVCASHACTCATCSGAAKVVSVSSARGAGSRLWVRCGIGASSNTSDAGGFSDRRGTAFHSTGTLIVFAVSSICLSLRRILLRKRPALGPGGSCVSFVLVRRLRKKGQQQNGEEKQRASDRPIQTTIRTPLTQEAGRGRIAPKRTLVKFMCTLKCVGWQEESALFLIAPGEESANSVTRGRNPRGEPNARVP